MESPTPSKSLSFRSAIVNGACLSAYATFRRYGDLARDDLRARSDVVRPYDVRMIKIPAFIAQEHISSYSILFTHMIAFWASLARVSRVYRLRFDTGKRRLVFNVVAQLRKCPFTHAVSLLLPEPFYEMGCQEKILPLIRHPGFFS